MLHTSSSTRMITFQQYCYRHPSRDCGFRIDPELIFKQKQQAWRAGAGQLNSVYYKKHPDKVVLKYQPINLIKEISNLRVLLKRSSFFIFIPYKNSIYAFL